jgi:hypothetical protein
VTRPAGVPAGVPACVQVVLCGAHLHNYRQFLKVQGLVLAALPDEHQDPADLPTYVVMPYDPAVELP